MPNRSSKENPEETEDMNELASQIVEEATAEDEGEESEEKEKNPHAQALGRLGGLKGGKARAAKLTPKQRQEIARKAANARWKKSE